MIVSSSSVVSIVIWGLLGGYLIVWLFRSFRNILAVTAGTMVAMILAYVTGAIVGAFFGITYAAIGVPENEVVATLGRSFLFWFLCIMIGIFCSYYVGFVAGMAAGSYEMFHACLASVLGIGFTPELPPELGLEEKLGSAPLACLVLVLNILAIALATWGGYMAKRGKARAEEGMRRGGPKLTGGPQPV